jgi:uncharacterized protein YrrD
MADPVAWQLIEPGWKVLDASGEEIGSVHEVTGDENADIFDGIAVSEGMLRTSKKYVPSEQVAEIVEGAVRLSVTADRLQDFVEPAAEERILPEGSSWTQRLSSWLTGRNR